MICLQSSILAILAIVAISYCIVTTGNSMKLASPGVGA